MVHAVCAGPFHARCTEMASRVVAQAEVEKVNPLDVVALAAIESAFNQSAKSTADAVGVMQITPIAQTAVNQALHGTLDRLDLDQNIRIGVAYWASLLKRFNGDVQTAVAAYNAGPSRVEQWVLNGRALPPETVNHVRKFVQLRKQCGG